MPFLENAAVKEREFRFHPQQGTRTFFHPLSHGLVWDLSSGLCDVSAILLSFSWKTWSEGGKKMKQKKVPLYLKIQRFVWGEKKSFLSGLKANRICDLEIILILGSFPKRKVGDTQNSQTSTPSWHRLQLLVAHFTFFSLFFYFPLLSFSEGRLNEWRWLKGSESGWHKKR